MNTISFSKKVGTHGLIVALLSGTILSTPGTAQEALPTGGQVVSGNAAISTSGGTMTVDQSSDKLVTNWETFSIGKDNAVIFNQPTAQSIALNRVIGQDPSRILGSLTANGKIFLLNPNGIVIGKDGSVQSGGFVGSTLGMTDKDFLNGQYKFTGASGAIVNQGDLKGGVVALIAPRVQNSGTITGDTALAAGTDVTLDFDGDGLISVEVSASTLGTLVENSGLIKADGGLAILTAKGANDALKGIVYNIGVVEAKSIENRDGRILLLGDMEHGEVNAAGTLEASFVETSAARVNIADGLSVKTNGGNWLIDPNDFTIAASGGNMTGATLSNNLANGNVTITTATQGTAGGNGDIFVNDGVTWSANKLTLNADRNININTAMNASGTAGLALEYAQTVATGDYYVNAPVNLASTGSFSTKKGSAAAVNYTIITSLGAAGSTTGTDLQGINGNLSGNYVLGSDVDASETSNWNGGGGFVPIGGSNSAQGTLLSFTGVFEGLGHKINKLKMIGSRNVGLFGSTLSSIIRNVELSDVDVRGSAVVGGLIGKSEGSTIFNAKVSGSVSGSAGGDTTVGGLIGSDLSSNITLSMANVLLQGERNIGGLIGQSYLTKVKQSHASGEIYGVGSTGGLIGESFYSTVENSYSLSRIFRASNSPNGDNFFGGLVGRSVGSSFTNVYASGKVRDADGFGGLIGSNDATSNLTAGFWDIDATGQSRACGINSGTCNASGLTTGQMKSAASFTAAGWDFNTIWAIDPAINNGYPYLRATVAASVVAPPPPPPPPPSPPPTLTINDFGNSFSTSAAPYQPSIALTGTAFSSVTEIRFTYTGPNGQTGTVIWNAANQFGGGRFVVGAGGTSATISPVLVAAGDPSGTYQWTVTFVAGSQSIARNFSVAYTAVVVPPPPPPPPPPPAIVPLSLTGGINNFYATGQTPYRPIFNLTGAGLLGVNQIRLTYTGPAGQSGTIILNAANGFNGRFTNVTNSTATFSPVLVAAGDPPGAYNWTATFTNGNQTVMRSFIVTYGAAPLETPIAYGPVQYPRNGMVLGVDTAPPLYVDTSSFLTQIVSQLERHATQYWVYAAMSNNVYDGREGQVALPPEWQPAESRSLGNGFYAQVFVRRINDVIQEVVVSFRGTDNPEDMGSGNFGFEQQAIARAYFIEIQTLYSRFTESSSIRFNVTGHSLGGNLAKEVAIANPSVTAVVFNSSPRGIGIGNIVRIEETGDPLDLIRANSQNDIRYNFQSVIQNAQSTNSLWQGIMGQHGILRLANGMRQMAQSPRN